MIRRLVLAIAIVGSMVIVAVLHVQAQAVATATPVPGTGNLASKPTWTSLKRFVATPSTIVVRRLAAITPKTPIATTTAPTPLRVQDAAAYAAAKNSPVGRQGVDIQPQAGSPVDFSYGALDARTADSVQGGGAEPPDTQMAVGRTQVFEMVNQTGELFGKNFPDGVIGVPFALKGFFLMPANYISADPRILYDYSTDRWYATMLGFDPSTTGPTANDSGVFLAISQTSDATGAWLVYRIYSGLNANADLTNLLCDQPKLGYSTDKFLVACTEFDHLGHYYAGVVIYTSKTQGLAGQQMAIGGVMSRSLFGAVPAQNLSAGNPAYVVENLSMGGAGTAGSWLITATGDPAAGPATITPTVVAMPFTNFPPNAVQQGSAALIDTGDDRFMSAVVQNGELWTSGTESCTPAGDTMIRSCMRVVQIGLAGATMDQSSTAGIIGKYIYYPTLSLTSTGDAIIGYSMSSSGDYPGFLETIQPAGASGHFYGDATIVAGAQAYTGTRWGDYGAAATDPSDGSKVWVAGEWSNVLSGYNFPSWSTEIGRISRIPSLCVLTSFTTDVPPPQLTSTTVNLMAAAGCVTNATPEYSFWIKPPGGSWGLVQPYGSATTYAWSSHALGTYALEADVRAVGETRSYDTYIDISFVIGPCTAPSLSTGAATSPYPTGSGPITLTATGSCSGGTQFEFWVRDVSTHWSILGGGYQSANTISWPANTAPGSYLLEVDLRPVGSSASYVTYVDSPPFFLAGCTLPTSLVATESSPQVAGTTVHWTASGACSGTPQYRFWVRTPDLVWHMLQDYNNSATFAWNSLNTQTGNYTVEVNVRNAGAIESFDTYTDVAYALGLCTAPTLSTSVVTSPYPTGSGAITLTGGGSCAGGTEFEFWVRDAGMHWSILGGGYQSANTISWPANTAPGVYLFEVDLRPVGSSASYVTYLDSPPFFLAGCTTAPTLTPDKGSPQLAGTTVTWTASGGSCSGTPEYRFWVRTPDLVWHRPQDYGSSATFVWSSLNTQAGSYTIEVNVRNAGATESYDTFTDVPYSLGLCTAPTLSTGAATSPYATGSGPVTLTATGSCAGGTQFEFWVRDPSMHWSILGSGYQSGNTISWPANTAPGSYLFEVDLRPVGSSASYVTYLDSPAFILTGCTSAPGLVPTEASPQLTGTTVHWTASGGSCSGTPQYRFWVRTPDLVWHMLQDYSSSATFAWNSLNTQAGNYTVEVNVRNAGATESYDTFTDVAYSLGLCTAPTLSTGAATSPYATGSGPITLTATGSCSGGTQFEFWIRDPSVHWSILGSGYQSANTISLPANTAPGSYLFEVDLRPVGSSASYVTYLDSPAFILTGCTSAPGLVPTEASPQLTGTTVHWTASGGSCSGTPQYRFWVRTPDLVWHMLQDYSSSATFAWNSLNTQAGNYTVEVNVRNAGATESYDTYTDVAYTMI